MDVAAVVALFFTVLVGLVVVGTWAVPARTNVRRLVVLMSFHLGAAVAAVTIWLVFAVGRSDVVGWIGVAVLAATIVLGVSTLLASRAQERSGPEGGAAAPKPVSAGLLIVHGAGAALAAIFAIAAVVAR